MFVNALQTVAQNYTYSNPLPTDTGGSGMNWFANPFAFVFGLVVLVAMWFVFKKAKRQGWEAIIPIYNTLVLIQIVNKPWWWILLLLIPFVNIVVAIMLVHRLSKAFGKDALFTVLLLLFPFIGYPILAWGDAKYKKPQ